MLVASGVIVARSLGAEDRGYLALLIAIYGICTFVASLGLFSAVPYYLARDPAGSRRIMRSLLGLAVVQVVAAVAVQAVVLVAVAADDPLRVQVAALISLLLPPAIFAYGYAEAILIGQQRFTAFNVFRAVPTTTYAVFVIVAFVLGVADIIVVMTIWAGASILGGALALAVAVRGLPKTAHDEPIPSRRTITVFGLKSFLGSLSPIETFRADQAVVGLFLSPVALGLYVVAQAFTNLPRAAAQSIGYISYPRVAASPDRTDARRALWKFFFLGVVVTGAVVAIIVVTADTLVVFFFGSEFAPAVPVARILLVGVFFSAIRRVLTDGLRGLGHPGIGTIAELSSWIFLVPAFAVLLPHGPTGVALALTIGWALSLAVALGFAVMEGKVLFQIPPTVLRSRSVVLVVGSAVVVVAAGVAAASFSLNGTLILVLVIAGMLFFAFGRATVRRTLDRAAHREDAPARAAEVATPASGRLPDPPDLRLPRAIYYLGLLLLALLTVRASGQVTFSDLLFLLSMMLAVADLIILRRNVAIGIPLLLLGGMAIFTIGGLLSSLESYAAFKSVATVARLIFLTVFWFWLGTVVLTRLEHIVTAIGLWVASAAICGTGAVAQLLAGEVIPNTHTIYGRSTGFTAQPNDLGGLCAIAFVPAVMLTVRKGLSPPRRLLAYLGLMLVLAGLVLSGSVGAMIAALVAVFVWFALQPNSRRTVLPFLAIVGAVLALTTFQSIRGDPTPLARFQHVTEPRGEAGAGSLESRIETYRVATTAIKRDPFLGVGLDLVSVTKPFGLVSYEYDVHNLVIGTWYKAGLFGLIGMLMVVIALLRLGWTVLRDSRTDSEEMMGAALLSSFVAFVAFAMSAPVLFSRYGWIPAALLLALRAVQLREPGLRHRAEPRPPTRGLRAVPVAATDFGR
jgi:O-antigen/teichoic acid export membrane protein/O-antigen ligase